MFSSDLKKKIKFESKTGFTYALELTSKAYFLKQNIIEIPSIWKEAENRKSNFKIFRWIPYYVYWFLYSVIKKIVHKKN